MNFNTFVLAAFVSMLFVSDGQASRCDAHGPFKKSRSSNDAMPMEQDLVAQHSFIDAFSKGEVEITTEALEKLNFQPIHPDLVELAYKDDRYALFALNLVHLGFLNRDLVEQGNRDILILINVRANRQIPAALYNLAFMYFHGIGGHTDASFARKCIEKASALGHMQSKFALKKLFGLNNDLNEEDIMVANMLSETLSCAQLHLRILPEDEDDLVKDVQDNCMFRMDEEDLQDMDCKE